MIGILLAAAAVFLPSPEVEVERVFQRGEVMIVLGGARGPCPEGEKVAAFVRGRVGVPGCWFERDETVWIWWRDGDRSAMPGEVFVAPPSV